MIFKGDKREILIITTSSDITQFIRTISDLDGLTIIWARNNDTTLLVDRQKINLKANQMGFLSSYQNIDIQSSGEFGVISFNKEFYCVIDHDSEVSCKGILFYHSTRYPIIDIPATELDRYNLLWEMFDVEIISNDDLVLDMLRSLLKRYLIMSTRLAKKQGLKNLTFNNINLFREFNFLVETHFKKLHKVQDYASLLHKSPKTIANVFTNIGKSTPLKIIHNRIIIEAQKLVLQGDLNINEISYALGFEDIQTFSRFFKKMKNVSPSKYKKGNN
ncbi:MAG: helix-turn-helix domain-containing protein [Candidatus Marinimicrobia bacterium]|nr:helix-turn-helix domain-containing protein [Candidatus Neomarinimicrobiota bacterium]